MNEIIVLSIEDFFKNTERYDHAKQRAIKGKQDKK